MVKISLKGRLIAAGIFFVITFVIMVYYKTSLNLSFILAFSIFVGFMILTDPKFEKWDKDRLRKMEHNKDIRNEEYQREKGRLKARDDFEQRGEVRTGLGPGILSESFFGKKRRR